MNSDQDTPGELEELLKRKSPRLLREAKRHYQTRGRGAIVLDGEGERYQTVDELRARVGNDPLGLIDVTLLYDPEKEAVVIVLHRPEMAIAIRISGGQAAR